MGNQTRRRGRRAQDGSRLRRASVPAGAQGKALTTWVRVWPSGESALLQVDKATLISNLGIQARDFRIMESQMTRQACSILCREKCFLVNMSYVRAIVTAHYILLVPPEDDRAAVFLGRLKERISQPTVGQPMQTLLLGDPPKLPIPVSKSMPSLATAATAAFAAAAAVASGGSLTLQPGTPPAVGVGAAGAKPAGGAGAAPAPSKPSASGAASVGMSVGSLLGLGPGRPALIISKPAAAAAAAKGAAMASGGEGADRSLGHGAIARRGSRRDGARRAAAALALAAQDRDEAPFMELPFELKALEICLDELAADIDQRTHELEFSLKPAIDGLARNVRNESLDLLRRLKTRLVTLRSLTQTVCAALEELLEDDDDMFDMNLTAKEQRELDLLQRVSFAISEVDEDGYSSDGSDSSDHSHKVSQVEMLLEAYFLHFDNTVDRLQDLMEDVGDTEAVVNIKLDAHQNRLLSVDLVAQFLLLINYLCLGVFGFFTMNLCPDAAMQSYWRGPCGATENADEEHYLAVLLPCLLGSMFVFATVMAFLYWKGILHLN
ncbi:hypothetical protein FOA52_001307 [Chlamydomonas sp. UWO 241]|nr:hypothetical protein FOA52_001307 [Chlamydomonas sp. UWO 241]